MRVLEVTHYMPPHQGGIEHFAEAIATGLRERGHEVRWIASATPARAGADETRTRVRAFNVLEDRIGLPYPIWAPTALAEVARLVGEADVVHAHDCLYMGSVAAAIACRARGVPLVLTQHVAQVPFGPLLDRAQHAAYATLGRAVLRAADRVLVVAGQVGAWCTSLAGVETELVANGVDDSFAPASGETRAAARARWGIAPDAKVVLFVGRLVPKKGIPVVVETQRALASDGTVLLAVGSGPLAGELARAPNLVWRPDVPGEAIPGLFAAADAFFLPSHGEGLPRVVQEALCSGLPVVVTDPDFAASLAGLKGVVACADGPSCATALRDLLAAPPAPASIASSARARWGTAAPVARYEAVLAEAVARASRRGANG